VSSAVFYRDLNAAYQSVVSADGMYLRTADGRRILDAVGGAGTVVLGHGVREITDAIAQHGNEVGFVYGATFANPWQEQLAAAGSVPAKCRSRSPSGAQACDWFRLAKVRPHRAHAHIAVGTVP
jgi:adenosylmethionine-8-amino-7-oxononanoate aminotransferase